MKNKKLSLITSSLIVALLSCTMLNCKKDHTNEQQAESKSSQKDILTFEIFKADNRSLTKDYNSNFDGNNITAILPAGTNLTSLKVAFTVSEKATVTVNGKLQTSQVSANDFTHPVIYTVKAENSSTKNYTVTITTK